MAAALPDTDEQVKQEETARPPAAAVEPAEKTRPARARAKTAKPSTQAVKKTRAGSADQRMLGSWWYRETYDRARSAYLVDLDTVPDPATSFGRWVGRAIEAHHGRTPAQRAQLAEQLGPEPTVEGETGLPRTHMLPAGAVEGIDDALRAERQAGRVMSASQYVSEAVRVATAEAEERHGGPLPAPPARLPSRAAR